MAVNYSCAVARRCLLGRPGRLHRLLLPGPDIERSFLPSRQLLTSAPSLQGQAPALQQKWARRLSAHVSCDLDGHAVCAAPLLSLGYQRCMPLAHTLTPFQS